MVSPDTRAKPLSLPDRRVRVARRRFALPARRYLEEFLFEIFGIELIAQEDVARVAQSPRARRQPSPRTVVPGGSRTGQDSWATRGGARHRFGRGLSGA